MAPEGTNRELPVVQVHDPPNIAEKQHASPKRVTILSGVSVLPQRPGISSHAAGGKLASLDPSDRKKLLAAEQFEAPVPALWLRDSMLIAWMACLAAAAGVYNPALAVASLAVLFAGLMIGDHVGLVLLPLLVVMPLDLRIDIGSQLVFLDLVYGILAIPLLRKLFAERRKVNLWPLALTGFIVMAVMTTYSRSEKVSWLLESGLRLAIVLIFATAIASYGKAEKIILAAGWSVLPAVGYGIYQMVIDGRGPVADLFSGKSEPTDLSLEWTGRPFSTLGQPNLYGGYCAIVSAMLLPVIIRSANGRRRKMAAGLTFLGVIGLLSSNSRGAWMGFAAAIAILTFMGYLRAKYLLAGIALVALILCALSALNLAGLAHASDFGEQATGGRIEVWGVALLVFANHPFIGIGWMNFAELLPSVTDWRYGAGMHAHDIYLSILAETGLIGFILFFAPIVIVLMRSARRSRSDIAALAGLLGLTVFLVHGVVDSMFYGPQLMLAFGVALGLASRADFWQRSWCPSAVIEQRRA